MGNQIHFVPTKFENVRSSEVSYGFRVYDSYGSLCVNTWESIPEDDLDFLTKVFVEACNNEDLQEMISFISENEVGCFVGEKWYDYNEIKDIVEATMEKEDS